MAKHGHQEAFHHLPLDLSLALLALGAGDLVLAGVVQAESPSDSIMDFRKPCEDKRGEGRKKPDQETRKVKGRRKPKAQQSKCWII